MIMADWDKPDNDTITIGHLTLYSRDYDGLSDYIHKFDWENMPAELIDLQDYFEEMMDSYSEDEDVLDEYDLVGLNSTSFKERNYHNLFLEWDKKTYVPDMDVLEEFNGMIVETDGGYHVIKEDNLLTSELIDLMKRYDCCPGFTNYSEQRFHACLRVCPKGSNKLRIIKNQEGFLYSVYRELVEGLENAWVS